MAAFHPCSSLTLLVMRVSLLHWRGTLASWATLRDLLLRHRSSWCLQSPCPSMFGLTHPLNFLKNPKCAVSNNQEEAGGGSKGEAGALISSLAETCPQTLRSQAMRSQTVSPQTVSPQTVSPQTLRSQTLRSQTQSPQTMPSQKRAAWCAGEASQAETGAARAQHRCQWRGRQGGGLRCQQGRGRPRWPRRVSLCWQVDASEQAHRNLLRGGSLFSVPQPLL
jgi:hypothetical protein